MLEGRRGCQVEDQSDARQFTSTRAHMDALKLCSANLSGLAALLRPWKQIWVPGGTFDFVEPIDQSFYCICSFAIESSSITLVGATATRLPDKLEMYPLELSCIPEIGTKKSEQRWSPPREPVADFPEDLDFRPFFSAQRSVSVLTRCYNEMSILDGLLFEMNNLKIMVVSSDDLPESLMTTACCERIERVLSERSLKRWKVDQAAPGAAPVFVEQR